MDVTTLLLRYVPHKQIGWEEIGEDFLRFQLVKTPWFNLYLHRLQALTLHPHCHDHPWNFVSLILKGGYWEYHGYDWQWVGPGALLYRPAEWKHNVVTEGVCWSLVLTGAKRRPWGFVEDCR